MVPKNIHFIGIGGSGISGVSSLAEKFGYNVTGCDLSGDTAYKKNILKGHSVSHIKNSDLVVISPALLYQNQKNEEIIEAEKQNKLVTWQEFLGKVLLKNKRIICVAGTHGKSTTTAMAGKLLIDNGFDPTIMVGAYVPEWGGNSRFGKGEYAVIEADEFNNNYLNYSPEIIILNNIEFDHPDFFNDESEVFDSFGKFVNRLTGLKTLIYNQDSPGVLKLLAMLNNKEIRLIPFSLNKSKINFSLKIFGIHNIKNAIGVIELGKTLLIKTEYIINSIENFKGIGRRLELIADRSGIKVYDDYAHHPTAIAATLDAVRGEYPNSKILVIDEPHGYKRTKILLSKYKGVFDSVDKVIIGPIYKARDEVDTSVTPQLVAKVSDHKDIVGLDSIEEIISNLKLQIENFNVIVVMGAGNSYLWAREIVKLLPVKFADLTTFRIGGTINKYFEAKNIGDVDGAVSYANKNKLPIFILGGGTDILVSDKDYIGVVVKYVADNYELKIINSEFAEITADAGMNWDKLVAITVENGLQGIESLSGIPGTCGAAPIQNIGAYGSELSETFISLNAYDITKQKLVEFSKEDCKFGYRESIFKQKDYWQKYIICSIKLKLKINNFGNASYESLAKYITSPTPTIKEIRTAVLKVRSEKLENPDVVGNAGSFFKNPIIDLNSKKKMEEKYPDIKIFKFGDKYKIPAGWLIEKTGWKGKSFKDAGVSNKHALILVNRTGMAKAEHIYDLSEKIINDVENKFGVKLEREVQLINF